MFTVPGGGHDLPYEENKERHIVAARPDLCQGREIGWETGQSKPKKAV